jgi:hypothetical protein
MEKIINGGCGIGKIAAGDGGQQGTITSNSNFGTKGDSLGRRSLTQ